MVSSALFGQFSLQCSHLLLKGGDVSLVGALLLQQISPLRLQAVHPVALRGHEVSVVRQSVTQLGSNILKPNQRSDLINKTLTEVQPAVAPSEHLFRQKQRATLL